MPSYALCHPIDYIRIQCHYEYIRRLEGLRTRHSYIGILYHKSLYNTRPITLLFIYKLFKKKIYENAKNEKKITVKNT